MTKYEEIEWWNYVERRTISIIKFVAIGLSMWIMTTLVLKLGIELGISVWLLTAFNTIFFGIVKYVVTDIWKVVKI